MIKIPNQAKTAIQLLNNQHYQAYLVGGFVRDTFLNKPSYDLDICTDALPYQIQECFKDYHVIETGIKHGTLTVIIDKTPIEITTFRIDKDYLDGRHPEEVEFTQSLLEDLKRRDFTINTLCLDQNGDLIDYLNGIDDLNHQIIRTVGNPLKRFEEDALRILRAIRFSAQCGFNIEPETKKALFLSKEKLKKVSIERIVSEFNKILLSDNAASCLVEYYDIFTIFLPELDDLKQHPQAYQKMIEAIHQTPALLTFRLTALFSTINVIKFDEAYNTIEDETIFIEVAKRMKYSNSIIKECHFFLHHQNKKLSSDDYSIKKYLNLWEKNLFPLLAYKQCIDDADRENLDVIKEKASAFIQEEACYSLRQLEINGNDLKQLNILGKNIKLILNECLDQVMQGNLVNRKMELIEYIKKEIK